MGTMTRTADRSTPATSLASRPTNGQAAWTPPPDGAWTYDDYARLPDNGFRYEVIDGELVKSPAPLMGHQLISAGRGHPTHRRAQRRPREASHQATPARAARGRTTTPSQMTRLESRRSRTRSTL